MQSYNALRLRFRLVASDFPGIVCILDGDRSGALELTQVVVHGDRVASWEEIALWFVLQCEWGRIATAIFQENETIMSHQNTLRGIVAVSRLSPAVVVDRAC